MYVYLLCMVIGGVTLFRLIVKGGLGLKYFLVFRRFFLNNFYREVPIVLLNTI